MFGFLKKAGKWIAKWLLREAKEELSEQVEKRLPMIPDNTIPRRNKKKRGR